VSDLCLWGASSDVGRDTVPVHQASPQPRPSCSPFDILTSRSSFTPYAVVATSVKSEELKQTQQHWTPGLHSSAYSPWLRPILLRYDSHYEGKSVNRSQMNIKRKPCDIRNWKKHLLLDISSTNTATLIPSLYQCVETRGTEVFWLLSQPLPHLRFNLFVISETSATLFDPVVNRLTRQTLPTVDRTYVFMNILCTESFSHKRMLPFGSILLKHGL
jgi:hypothetical protein